MTKRKRYARGHHPNSRKNLRKTPPPPAPPGNKRALRHGARAKPEALPGLAQARQDLYRALAERVPVRADDGGAHPADEPTIEQAAIALARVRSIDAWLARHGVIDREGNVRPAVAALEKTQATAADLLDKLGLNPRSRVALGLDIARGFDLAAERAADLRGER